ncbi:MAG: Gfo/Idh/MocA family oxidoreductase, partial [Armatimonadetes bacterium]|nr:Gfo/Idh/MocA family oxidoreductase [Armatimonadota bacterium]
KVGVIGCGNISPAYLRGHRHFSDFLEITTVADLDRARAEARAEEFAIPRATDVSTLLADPEIEIVINLTIPRVHGEVGIQVLEAGKSVYNEKPLALTRDEGRRMLEIAEREGLRVGCAPDTFMGAGIHTCRKLIDDGAIGEPVAATAFMMGRGHESWHPDPEFYYKPGGGPMFDMGPYYLTALVFLLGPVKRVTGATRISFPERTITSKAKHGQTIRVDVPTHVTGLIDFHQGAVGTIIQSFDVYAAPFPPITVFGSEGTLSVPDPNGFGGTVRLWQKGEWQEVPHAYPYTDPGRSIGVADMAVAIRQGRKHRANGRLAYHVLDLMHAFHDSSNEGRHIELESTVERPDPLPPGDVLEAIRQS